MMTVQAGLREIHTVNVKTFLNLMTCKRFFLEDEIVHVAFLRELVLLLVNQDVRVNNKRRTWTNIDRANVLVNNSCLTLPREGPHAS